MRYILRFIAAAALSLVVSGFASADQAGQAVRVPSIMTKSAPPGAGVVGYSTAIASAGVYGENLVMSSYGVMGYGDWGVLGRATHTGAGVVGQAGNVAGSRGVLGTSSVVQGSVGVEAMGTLGNLALRTWGPASMNGQVTLATGAVTPLVLPIVSVKPVPVAGGVALHSSYGLIVSDGVSWFAAGSLVVVP